jgi:hypothetical protein
MRAERRTGVGSGNERAIPRDQCDTMSLFSE